MNWFWRMVIQWVVIAIFACLPFIFPSAWPVIPIFSSIVVIGLLLYGLLNPAYALRRALIWGATSCLAIALAPINVEAMKALLGRLGLSQLAVDVLSTVLEWLTTAKTLSWQAVAVLFILLLAEVVRIVAAKHPDKFLRSESKLDRAEIVGHIFLGRGHDVPVLEHRVVLTNLSGGRIRVSGASLRVLRLFRREASLYSEASGMNEVTNVSPVFLGSGESVDLEVTCRNLSPALVRILKIIRTLHLGWLFDISASVRLHGHAFLPNMPTGLRFVIA